MKQGKLRERGIYLTPDGKSVVASRSRSTTSDGRRILSQVGSRLSYFLFGRYEWAFHGEPDFEVESDGHIHALKTKRELRIEELTDTGATAGSH